MNRCGRKFLLLSVFFLVYSALFCGADVTLTEEEYQELTTIFGRLGNLLDEQEIALNQLNESLEKAEHELGKSLLEITTQELTLSALKSSLDKLRREAVMWGVIGALGSLAVGLIVGLIL